MGTYNGLFRHTRQQEGGADEEYFFHDPKNLRSINHDMVYAIPEDRRDTLWLGTDRGLARFDRELTTKPSPRCFSAGMKSRNLRTY